MAPRKSIFGDYSFYDPETFQQPVSVSFRNAYKFAPEEDDSPFKSLASRFQFDTSQPADSTTSSVSRPTNRFKSKYGAFQEIQEETSAIDAFRNYLQRAPQREDYAPGLGNRIGAAIAGFGVGLQDPAKGFALSQSMIEQPYRRAQEAYEAEGGRLGSLAEIEATTNKARLEDRKAYQEYLKNLNVDEREDFKANLTAEERDLAKERFGYEKERDEAQLELARQRLRQDGMKSMVNDKGEEVWFNVNEINDPSKHVNLGKTSKARELVQGDIRADAARTTAGAAASRAATDAARLTTVDQPRAGIAERAENRMGETALQGIAESRERITNMGEVPQQEQYAAKINAAMEVITSNPEYSSHFQDGKFVVDPWGTDNEKSFTKFMEKVNEKAEELLSRQYKNLRRGSSRTTTTTAPSSGTTDLGNLGNVPSGRRP